MNKDQVKGRTTTAKGKIKETVGKATGNKEQEAEGAVEKGAGKARSTWGDVKDDVKKSTR